MATNIPIHANSAVTTIIVQRPLKNQLAAYENWLTEIVPLAQTSTGHRGVSIIRPHGQNGEYTIVLHFDSETNLRHRLDSDVRKQLIEKVRPFLHSDEIIDIKTGLEFWFTPARGSKAAPPYKQFLLTLSALFPISLLVSQLLIQVIPVLSFLGIPLVRTFVSSLVIVGLTTFVVMPRYVRLVANWLYS